jgi:hypothetical protein
MYPAQGNKLNKYTSNVHTVTYKHQCRPEQQWPDGIFSYQKYNFGYVLEGLGMENFGIFYVHFLYFMVIWYILPVLYQEKSGNHDCQNKEELAD